MKSSANKVLLSGNHAVAEAAIRAGCHLYFGYPITPQNEIPEYMSEHLPKIKGGAFVQAESELAAINMVLGAAATGRRVMTTSSSPGISLMQEGISYLAALELPCVIANMVRGGPGLGNIATAQSDYFQSTRGGGHGDYRTITLAPCTVQEIYDLTQLGFYLADKYRGPVIIQGEGLLGQMVEPVELKEPDKKDLPPKDWALTGAKDRPGRMLRSLILEEGILEEHNWKLNRKYLEIEKKEKRFESFQMEDANLAVVAYGSVARIAKGAIKRVREEGLKVGMIRPISLWPFPGEAIRKAAEKVSQFLVIELSCGQMIEDVRLALAGKAEVNFYGRPGGGVIPNPAEFGRVISRNYYQKVRKAR